MDVRVGCHGSDLLKEKEKDVVERREYAPL